MATASSSLRSRGPSRRSWCSCFSPSAPKVMRCCRLRAGPRPGPRFPRASRASEALPRRRLRVPHALLLPEGRPERLAGAGVGKSGIAGTPVRGQAGYQVRGVYPAARRSVPADAMFTTLLMSTGLTFGTTSSLYGLNAGILDRAQFSVLIAVVVASAVIPTVIAQRWFSPQARGGPAAVPTAGEG